MITIVIPNYNGIKYLGECLESIYEQDYKDYELIIIDNASTDDSYQWLKQDKKVVFIQLDKNYGFSYAVNKGIRLAKGEYVLLLNNDTKLCKDFLSEALQAIERDSRIFGVSSKMIRSFEKDLIDDAGDEYTVIGWPYKRGDGHPIKEFGKEERIFSTCAGAGLYRKKIFDEIGYFDESFFAYMEDVDISYRANIYGYKNVYVPSAQVYHIGSATSGGQYSDFKIRLSARNSVYVPYKNMPLLQLLINMPWLILGTLVKQRVFESKGYGKAYKEGIVEGIKSLKDVKKVPFRIGHISQYIYIEWLLIKNTFRYARERKRRLRRN